MDDILPPAAGAYENVGAYLEGRGYRVAEEPLRPQHVTPADLVAGRAPTDVMSGVLGTQGVWEIVARADPEAAQRLPEHRRPAPAAALVLYLLADDGKYARDSKNLGDLFSVARRKAENVGGELREILVLASESVIARKHVVDQVKSRNAEAAAQRRPDRIYLYPFYVFACDLPRMPAVSRHEVVSREEAARLLKMYYLTPKQIPYASAQKDPAIIWCGGRPGDFVQVWQTSETAADEVPVLLLVV